MPLSEQEQRLLDEMERNLYHNDADFVAQLGGNRGRPNYRAIVLGVLVVVVGIGTLVAGVALNILILGIAGFVLMFGGVLLALRPSRRLAVPEELPADGAAAKKGPRQNASFMDKLNERWDKRQDGEG